MDPSEGYLNGILARVGGNLNNNFQKSQMPGGLPGGACWSFDLTDTLETNNSNTMCFTSDADYFSVLYLSL